MSEKGSSHGSEADSKHSRTDESLITGTLGTEQAAEGNKSEDQNQSERIPTEDENMGARTAASLGNDNEKKNQDESKKTKGVCTECESPDHKFMIQCFTCQKWTHYECTKLPAYRLTYLAEKKSRRYICKQCIQVDPKIERFLRQSLSTREADLDSGTDEDTKSKSDKEDIKTKWAENLQVLNKKIDVLTEDSKRKDKAIKNLTENQKKSNEIIKTLTDKVQKVELENLKKDKQIDILKKTVDLMEEELRTREQYLSLKVDKVASTEGVNLDEIEAFIMKQEQLLKDCRQDSIKSKSDRPKKIQNLSKNVRKTDRSEASRSDSNSEVMISDIITNIRSRRKKDIGNIHFWSSSSSDTEGRRDFPQPQSQRLISQRRKRNAQDSKKQQAAKAEPEDTSYIEKEIEVPHDCVGTIVGKGGWRSSHIQEITNTIILVPEGGSGNTMKILGIEKKSVSQAEDLIMALVRSHQQGRSGTSETSSRYIRTSQEGTKRQSYAGAAKNNPEQYDRGSRSLQTDRGRRLTQRPIQIRRGNFRNSRGRGTERINRYDVLEDFEDEQEYYEDDRNYESYVRQGRRPNYKVFYDQDNR